MTKVEELLLEAIKERYEFELDRIQRLDNKAYNILGIAGVLATLTSGLASLSITVTLNVLGIVIISVFILCICMLLYSFYLGLKAYQIRSFMIIPDPPLLIQECEEMSESELRQTLYYNYAEATEKNMSKNEEKILHLKSATRLVFASLIAFFVLALLLVIKGH